MVDIDTRFTWKAWTLKGKRGSYELDKDSKRHIFLEYSDKTVCGIYPVERFFLNGPLPQSGSIPCLQCLKWQAKNK